VVSSYASFLQFRDAFPEFLKRQAGVIVTGEGDERTERKVSNGEINRELRDQGFARQFLLAAIDEGVPLQVALGKVVRAMGVKEFAAKVRMASPNLLRALNPRHNPTQDTLTRLLKPFRLKLTLAPIDRPKGRHAA
jgi:DNA-binding phage protein